MDYSTRNQITNQYTRIDPQGFYSGGSCGDVAPQSHLCLDRSVCQVNWTNLALLDSIDFGFNCVTPEST